jgi:hypothetical protein
MKEEMVVAIGEGAEQRSRAAAGRRKRSVIRIQRSGFDAGSRIEKRNRWPGKMSWAALLSGPAGQQAFSNYPNIFQKTSSI